jgi:Cell division protein CrgA
MAKPVKRRVPGGRVTTKKRSTAASRPDPSTRYTPPVPREVKSSPVWVPVLMFFFLIAGMLVILANYMGILPGDTSNAYLGIGLGCICAGILVATQYR